MKHLRKVWFALGIGVLLVVLFTWRGYLEWYWREPAADVRVNGVPAGFAHRGPVSTIVTRTDVADNHSYRVWETPTDVLIFDCVNWVAPDRRVFPQGRVHAPCIFDSGTGNSSAPTAPASKGELQAGVMRFTTRDKKVIAFRTSHYTERKRPRKD